MGVEITEKRDKLCARCGALELEKLVASRTENSWNCFVNTTAGAELMLSNSLMVARFKSDSIQLDGVLCNLFSQYFVPLPGRQVQADLMLWAHHHTEGYDMVSLSLRSSIGHPWQYWLFPVEQPQEPLYGVIHGTGHPVKVDCADIALAKSWLEQCRAKHKSKSKHCTPVTLSLKTPLKVIDCQTRQVRVLHEHETYVCLSYVWGNTTTNENFNGLQLPEKIGKTIEDAIYVSQQLGIPRLWVDQYCINQQHSEEKSNIIKVMDRIYGGAEITIVDAGDHPLGGLPGINGTTRRPQRVVHFRFGSYVEVGDILRRIKSSPWNSRAWTYQEGLLAPRRLIFSNSQMYF